jgi:hypothetical protein
MVNQAVVAARRAFPCDIHFGVGDRAHLARTRATSGAPPAADPRWAGSLWKPRAHGRYDGSEVIRKSPSRTRHRGNATALVEKSYSRFIFCKTSIQFGALFG